MNSRGIVYFVGAGPGDPGLITLRGLERLRQADVILFDYLVNPAILEHAAAEADQICLGRHGRSTIWSQTAINARLVKEALQGKTVVRLKGGDPMVFGRASEELGSVSDAGIPFEVIPGVTAALAGASCAGLPITHREHASAVAFITGQENPAKKQNSIDFQALARFPGTLVFYMGITTSRYWSQQLIQAGMSAKTPVTLIRRCSWPDQQTLRCSLHEVANQVTPYQKFPPPAIAIVGDINHQPTQDWFESKPLFGQSILVTRPQDQAAQLANELRDLGANVLRQPAIAIKAPDSWAEVDRAIDRLSEYDWILFTSSNGVRRFLDRIFERGQDLRLLGTNRLAAVGTRTANTLQEYHLQVDLRPDKSFRSESLAEALKEEAAGKRFLLPRASRGRELLADELRKEGAEVDCITVYRHVDVTTAAPEIAAKVSANEVDWVTVTSSAIAHSLVRLFGDDLHQIKIATISSLTSASMKELGFSVTAEAAEATNDGILQAILSTQD
ncbi:MAG: uroporphyrinogen-III C-methyltransferase [Pirellulaceae bacterium]|nr:uroporphyrinogen-III C-methyltransferase [Pirellulaceae bacterium]